ncbi:MAG: hypothetical protein K6G51_05310 [Sphaerochaetaceae bacterium]|nr:hypothetical protein [Sphaerochaetaceae bacterium]
MARQISFNQYRTVDLLFFSLIMAVCETGVMKAATAFPYQPYVLSVVPAVVCIMYMRWGAWGILHSILGGIVACFVSKGTAAQYVIYCLGNIFSAVSLFFLYKLGKEKVRENVVWTLLYAALVALLMQVGRGIVAIVLGNSLGVALRFILTDLLSGLFSVVVVWICRRLDGVFEDQKTYLLRINREEGGA